jgi:Flp pilus assembly pilin Flp
MRQVKKSANSAQSVVEYAIIIVLVAVVVIGALILLGPSIANLFKTASSGVSGGQAAGLTSTPQQTAADIQARLQAFYTKNGRWPRTWGDFRFTDIGLNPADYTGLVNGISWNPAGDKVGLANVPGDNVQLYVKDLQGNNMQVYDGWCIWCLTSGACYYHTVAPGNEVDISTLQVITQ